MKCLLCTQRFGEEEKLRKYYFDFHKVDPFNHFILIFFQVSFTNIKSSYNFEKFEELVHNFLKNFRSKYNPPDKYVVIKCGFLIENLQPGPVENDSLTVNTRYWSTEPYRTKYFNDYRIF